MLNFYKRGSLPLIPLILLIGFVISGTAYFFTHKNFILRTDTPEANVTSSIAIDESSLTTSSFTPTITGTARHVAEIHFKMRDDKSGSLIAMGSAAPDPITGVWSFSIDTNTAVKDVYGNPLGISHKGKYSIEIFTGPGEATAFTSVKGTLKVIQTQ
jgi:hypothetical protein